MSHKIKLFSPAIEPESIANVNDALTSDWISSGPYVKQLETEIQSRYGLTGRTHNVALNSCTAALHIACWLLGLKPGDEVIVPSMTFVASIAGVIQCGATPVIVDVDPDSLLITEEIVKRAITPRTKAVIVVHWAGQVVDLDRWTIDLPIIEDYAQAMGSIHPFRDGTIRCWSFHAVKNLTGGVGGMISVNSEELARKCKSYRWVGIQRDTFDRSHGSYIWDYDIEEHGLNYYMCNLNAAVLCGQLPHFWEHQKIRIEIARHYDRWLSSKIKKIDSPTSAHYIYPIRVSNREGLIDCLEKAGIETGVHHRPLHTFPTVKERCIIKDVSIVDKEWKNLLSIPLHCKMSYSDTFKIVDTINQYVGY